MALLFVFTLLSGLHIVAADTCDTDIDCSLNGVCTGATGSRSCQCHVPWTGMQCGILQVGKADPGGAYGWSPNISSWGGNPVKGDDGQYHLFVAVIPGGLRNWGHASQCVHAVSPRVQGPFTRQATALGQECHNPTAIRHPSTGEYLLFHIGSGGTRNSSSFLHSAPTPRGPWAPAATAPQSCNNPAPAYHPNGSLFVICNHMQITTTDSGDWNGTWTPLRKIGHPDKHSSRPGHWEDPFLWFDANGNFHIIYHVYCLDPYEKHNECYSGHAFSVDGYAWTFGAEEPFSGVVNFTDGSSRQFATRERPHLIFADAGTRHVPSGVFTAVSNQPVSPACQGCKHSACSQCKVTNGRDWTFTQFEPFVNF